MINYYHSYSIQCAFSLTIMAQYFPSVLRGAAGIASRSTQSYAHQDPGREDESPGERAMAITGGLSPVIVIGTPSLLTTPHSGWCLPGRAGQSGRGPHRLLFPGAFVLLPE